MRLASFKLRTPSGWHYLAAGFVLASGLEPTSIVVHVPFVLMLTLWGLAQAPTGQRAAIWAMSFGFGYFGLALRWIIEPMLVDRAETGWMAPFALVFLAGGMALFWALGAFAAQPMTKRVSPLAVALGLALAEALRGWVFGGFPWANLAQMVVDTPASWGLPLLGPGAISSLMWLLCGLLAMVWRRQKAAAATVAVLLGVGCQLLPGPHAVAPAGDALTVRVVQPNARQDQKWDPAYAPLFHQRLLDLTAAPPAPELIIWPEMSNTGLWAGQPNAFYDIADSAAGVPVVFGAARLGSGGYYNSMIVLDQNGLVDAYYDKRHLVPFGEFIPGGQLAARLGLRGLASGGLGYMPGRGAASLDIPGIGVVRPLICYEGIFPAEVRAAGSRPRALVLITNDAWFGDGPGPAQHLVQSRMRALELGLPMVRAANTGISAIIDARGVVTKSLPLGASGFLDGTLPQALSPTFYARWGRWPHLLLLVAGLLITVILGKRQAR